MNKHVVLVQFNKRSKVKLINQDLDLIAGMKSYNPEKICSAFSMLSGKDLGLKDLELLLLIIDLAEALEPPVIRTVPDPFGPTTPRTPGWPYDNRIMCDSKTGDVLQAFLQGSVN